MAEFTHLVNMKDDLQAIFFQVIQSQKKISMRCLNWLHWHHRLLICSIQNM